MTREESEKILKHLKFMRVLRWDYPDDAPSRTSVLTPQELEKFRKWMKKNIKID